MRTVFILFYIFLFIITTFASFASITNVEHDFFGEKSQPKLPGEISRVLQTEPSFKLIETRDKTSSNYITRYIVNENRGKAIQLPQKIIPPLYYASYNNRIIFSGHSQNGTITMIVDSENFQTIDTFLHFTISDNYPLLQSPSGRYLLFRKFSPRNAPPNIASDFIMAYDLKKTPKENRMRGDFNNTLKITIENSEVGKFFYPENKNLEYSTETPYFTRVDSKDKQIFLYSTAWDVKNNIAVISEKSRLNEYKLIIVSEASGNLNKRIYDLKDAKLYTKSNTEVKYHSGMNFFMERFEVVDGILYIYNGAENPSFQTCRLKIDI